MGIEIAWSVGVEATGDRVLPTEQILDLADAVAHRGGSASGIGTNCTVPTTRPSISADSCGVTDVSGR